MGKADFKKPLSSVHFLTRPISNKQNEVKEEHLVLEDYTILDCIPFHQITPE